MAAALALFSGSCSSPPPTSFDITDSVGNTQDYLFIAITAIEVLCPDFGAQLYEMWLGGDLGWGSTEPYGESTIGYDGTIKMNEGDYGPQDIDMLIADLFHEAAHALNNEDDERDQYGAYVYVNDSFGRGALHHTSYDDIHAGNGCP